MLASLVESIRPTLPLDLIRKGWHVGDSPPDSGLIDSFSFYLRFTFIMPFSFSSVRSSFAADPNITAMLSKKRSASEELWSRIED